MHLNYIYLYIYSIVLCHLSVGVYGWGRESQPASRLVIWQQLKFKFVNIQPIICPADIHAGGDKQSHVSADCEFTKVASTSDTVLEKIISLVRNLVPGPSMTILYVTYFGLRTLSFSDHYCQSTCRNVILSVCLYVHSFFKMHLLQQVLSELDEILTQCSSVWCVYMILTDSWSRPYDVIAASKPNCLPACQLGVSSESSLVLWWRRVKNMVVCNASVRYNWLPCRLVLFKGSNPWPPCQTEICPSSAWDFWRKLVGYPVWAWLQAIWMVFVVVVVVVLAWGGGGSAAVLPWETVRLDKVVMMVVVAVVVFPCLWARNCSVQTLPLTMHYGGENWGEIGKGMVGFWPQRTWSYFLGSRLLCKVSSKLTENCNRRSGDSGVSMGWWWWRRALVLPWETVQLDKLVMVMVVAVVVFHCF